MQDDSARRSNKSRSEDMRARLMAAARGLFIEKGFANTGTPEIVRAAKVTRGALYHHFADKSDLFRAVVRAEAAAVAQQIYEGSPPGRPGDPLQALQSGSRAYFVAMQAEGRVRLLLLDGPSVLGFGEMAKIDAAHGGATLRAGLADMLEGSEAPLDAMADILSASFERAAIAIAQGAPAAPYHGAISIVLDGLADAARRN